MKCGSVSDGNRNLEVIVVPDRWQITTDIFNEQTLSRIVKLYFSVEITTDMFDSLSLHVSYSLSFTIQCPKSSPNPFSYIQATQDI